VSTGAIIAIVVGVLILLVVLAVLMPRMRERSRQRQLETRRGELADEHRNVAAEQQARARAAQSEAKRAEADLHEQGLADDEIVGDRDGRVDDADVRDDPPLRRT
jgi:Flp pilus assembly protein TadB